MKQEDSRNLSVTLFIYASSLNTFGWSSDLHHIFFKPLTSLDKRANNFDLHIFSILFLINVGNSQQINSSLLNLHCISCLQSSLKQIHSKYISIYTAGLKNGKRKKGVFLVRRNSNIQMRGGIEHLMRPVKKKKNYYCLNI